MQELTLNQVAALWEAMAGEISVGANEDESLYKPKARECRAILQSIFDRLPYEYKSGLMHESKRNGEDKTTREQVREFFQACADALASDVDKATKISDKRLRLIED